MVHEATVDAPGARGPVPITMGSPRFETLDAGPFRVTRASFVGGDVLGAHTHDRATFAVILSGGFHLRFPSPAIRRRAHDCVRGTVFTEPVGETHSNRILGEGASVLVIQADPGDDTLRGFAPLLDGVHTFTHAGVELAGRRLARELETDDRLAPLAAQALAVEMLVTATRRLPGHDGDRRGGRPPWLRAAEEFAHDCFRRPVRLDDIARAAGVSASHLSSVFRAVHGVSIGGYIRTLRIEWAAERLASGTDPIALIALQAGFADQAHLTRAFKRATGKTPGSWRRAHTT